MIYLYENENIKDEYKSLKECIKNTPSLHSYFESNFNQIKPKNYCWRNIFMVIKMDLMRF